MHEASKYFDLDNVKVENRTEAAAAGTGLVAARYTPAVALINPAK